MSLDNTPGTDMSLAILILTKEGLQVAERLKSGLPQADLYVAEGVEQRSSGRACSAFGQSKLCHYNPFSSISKLTADIFHKYDGLVFIMALGIVIRAVAPHIKDKHSDPAVVVVDDVGRFAILALTRFIEILTEKRQRKQKVQKNKDIGLRGLIIVEYTKGGYNCRKYIAWETCHSVGWMSWFGL